jgi:hypothetical protein
VVRDYGSGLRERESVCVWGAELGRRGGTGSSSTGKKELLLVSCGFGSEILRRVTTP